jgi:tetratricopeptide (TPR) repeat protein
MLKIVMCFALLATLRSIAWSQHERGDSEEAWSKTAPDVDKDLFQQVLEYRKRGEFEKAVALATKPSHGKNPDDFLLQTTAVTYFERAQADQSNKEKWVSLAVKYSERALQANPKDLINVFNLADSYMAAGMNLPRPESCKYYEKSLNTFRRIEKDSALQGDWGTIDGERVRLQPYREKL